MIGTYNSVLRSLSLHEDPLKAARRADEIFEHLRVISEGDPSMKPNHLTIKAIVTAWSRVKGHGAKQKLEFYRGLPRFTK